MYRFGAMTTFLRTSFECLTTSSLYPIWTSPDAPLRHFYAHRTLTNGNLCHSGSLYGFLGFFKVKNCQLIKIGITLANLTLSGRQKSCQLNLEIMSMFLTVMIIDIATRKNYAFLAICRRTHVTECRHS